MEKEIGKTARKIGKFGKNWEDIISIGFFYINRCHRLRNII